LLPIQLGGFDVFVLSALVATNQQQDHQWTVFAKINAVSGPEFDSELEYTFAYGLTVTQISLLQPVKAHLNLRTAFSIPQTLNPVVKRNLP